MTPSIGRIVTLRGTYAEINGADQCPAMITRVWDDGLVNLAAIPDMHGAIVPLGSVKLFDSFEAYDAARQEGGHDAHWVGAHWPTQV